MAINPELITTIRVDQLPDGTLNLTNKIPHTSGTVLEKASVQDLVDLVATAIGVSGGVGYIALSVTDGQQLPDVPELPSFFLCGAGTFLNINGYPNIICTENLNAIMSLTDHWELAVEIPINPLSGTVQSVTGSAVDNTDPLNPIVNLGGSAGTLAETLVLGNLTDGTDISISDGDKILLDNGANLKKGTTDAGLGGSKGIALRCAVDYELKWEAGRLYVMGGDGFTIREVSHNFTTTPTVNDDDTKGFIVDSRWILDNGNVYICTDATTGAAVWELQDLGTIPTLQQVTDEGATTTNAIETGNIIATDVNGGEPVLILNYDTNNTNTIAVFTDANTGFSHNIDNSILTDNRNIALPDASGTIALTSDITIPTLQDVTDEGADAYGNTINLKNSSISDSTIQFNVDNFFEPFIKVENLGVGSAGHFTKLGSSTIEFDGAGDFNTILQNGDGLGNTVNLPTESGTLALTSDLTAPTLQDVTDEGNTTTNDVKVNSLGLYSGEVVDYGYLSWSDDLGLSFINHNTQKVFNADKTSSSLSFINGDDFKAKLDATLLSDNRNFVLQDSDGTLALTSDIPAIQAGTNITIDNTDPLYPIINASGGSNGIPHATASGTDTYTATVTGVAAYADGDAYLIRFTNGNTSGATLNINSLGAKTLYRNNDGALIGGDIINGGEMLCIYNSTTSGFQCIGTAPNSLFSYVTNADSVTLTKGMPVYAFGGTGDRMTVKRAYNTLDATSAQTVGLVLSTSIAANQKGLIMMQGLLDGLSILPTSTWADGDPVYLGATAGTITKVKPYAPNHLVYLGVVTTASNGSAGRMYVRVQNGYELSEIHDVDLITNAPTNNQALTYETSSLLWKNKTIIEDSITNGVTDKAPSQNAVFDALALKADTYPNYPFNTTTNYFGLFDIVPTISTSVVIGSTANNTNTAVAFNRFSVDKEITISDFAILQNGANDGASATVTLYIFDDTNAGLPGVKLHQETTATGILAVAQKYIAFTNNITLQKGNYWIALHFRGLNTAGTNPSFIGGLVNQPNVVTSIASYNINFRPLITGATSDLSNNPTITLGGFINFPQIFIKI